MDNAAFERDAAAQHGDPGRRGASRMAATTTNTTTTVEMGELCGEPPRQPLCRPDVCRGMMAPQATLAAQSLVRKSAGMRPNPWHRYKTVLLVATVVGLVVWAVAYVVLEQLDIL